jgi:very-short-patch-repair endonuclease
MHQSQNPGAHARRLAAAQEGFLTTAQAALFGLGEDALSRLVRDGHWERTAQGLYDLRPGQDSFDRRLWSAVLRAGEPSALGGGAALHLHGLQSLQPVGATRLSEPVEVWVPADRRPRGDPSVIVRRDRSGRLARARGLPPRICVEDALIDVCVRLPVEDEVARLTEALRLRLTTPDRLIERVAQRTRLAGRRQLLAVLADLAGVESSLEWVFRRDVERAHRLPKARRQVSVSRGSRSDGFYEEQGVLVEIDGRRGHEDSGSSFRDLDRDNRHTARGLTTLRYGSADLRGRPCEVARQVWEALAARGLTEPFHPCPRCRARWWTISGRDAG